MLDTATGLANADFASLKGGNDVYLSILGVALPRMPQWLALPLSLLLFVALAFASYMARERKMRWDQQLLSFAMPPVVLVACAFAGWGLYEITQLVSAMPDPTYAYPVTFRVALSFAIAGIVLTVSAMAPAHGLARAAWLWLAGLGIVTAVFVPGISPYFLIPSLLAALLLLLAARSRNRWLGQFGQIALLLTAGLNLVIWLSLVAAGETLMGLKLHPLFTIPAALGLVAIVPLLAIGPITGRMRNGIVALCFVIAVAASAAAGLIPSYSEVAPRRMDLTYVEDHTRNRTLWAADAGAPLPDALHAVEKFSPNAEQPHPVAFQKAYIARAGNFLFTAPKATARKKSHRVTVTFNGSQQAEQMFLVIPKAAGLKSVEIGGWHIPVTPSAFNSGNR